MPMFRKVIKAAELPSGWAGDFNPEQLVVVTISDDVQNPAISGRQRLGHQINLAAPSPADKAALSAMGRDGQKALYEDAILRASAQPGHKISKEQIKAAALKLPFNG